MWFMQLKIVEYNNNQQLSTFEIKFQKQVKFLLNFIDGIFKIIINLINSSAENSVGVNLPNPSEFIIRSIF